MARKLSKYQKIVCDYLADYAQNRNRKTTTYQFLADSKRHHYQVLRMQWDKNVFYCTIIFHFELAETGKLWIWVNNTDILIAEELVNLGIPKEDIVLGFHSPEIRTHTGYAVA